jgi:acetyltransferase-like isoleucine patch superfamily enzyme
MRKVIVFGNRDFASLAHFYIESDAKDAVVMAFCADKEFMDSPVFEGREVADFETLEEKYPPSKYDLFIPISDNNLRQKKYEEGKRRGYKFYSYVSTRATVFSDVGENCFILEDNTIQPFVSIGNNVIMWSGNHIGHHSVIEDNVFISSHVVICGHVVVRKKLLAWCKLDYT